MPWDDATRRGGATRSSIVAAVVVVAASALVLLIAVWAASTGPGDPLRGDGADPPRMTPSQTETTAPTVESTETDEEPEESSEALNTVMTVVLGVIGAAMLASVVWLLVGVRLRVRRPRRRARSEAASGLGADDDVVGVVTAALVDDADEQLRLLEEGSPRNGIVACWHRFELRAAAVGVAREPWETSAEFTLRLLDLVAADDHAVARLAVRYREARFSDHPITEADRTEARRALTVIQAALRSGSVGPAASAPSGRTS